MKRGVVRGGSQHCSAGPRHKYGVPLFLTMLALPGLAHAASLPVAPGQPIQPALSRAQPGDTVQLADGTYTERVTLPRGVTLQGTGAKTILVGDTPAPSWSPAPEMGTGVWKATLGSPQALTVKGKAVWRLSDKSMGNGEGKKALSRSGEATVNIEVGQVQAWDGIEALFGTQGGTTYLKLRNGQNPSSMGVRVAPGGAVVTMADSTSTVKNLSVRGGQTAIQVTGNSNVIDGVWLGGGKNRVVIEGQATGTILRNSTLRADTLGFVQYMPGDRDTTPPARRINRWLYNVSKFLVGDTETNDASIMISGRARNTQVLTNDIGVGLMGIVFYGTTSGTTISGNYFHHFADIGIYVNADSITNTQITGNRFVDMEHGLRLESAGRTMHLRICGNRFEGVTKGAKHIFIPPLRGGGVSTTAQVEICENAFTGGGWAVDMGGTSEVTYRYPGVVVRNNLLTGTGMSSGGTAPIGVLSGNRMGGTMSVPGDTAGPSTAPAVVAPASEEPPPATPTVTPPPQKLRVLSAP